MEIKLEVKLKEVLQKRNDMTQKELAELTNIRTAAISELFNNQRTSINKSHLEKIASALNITDIRELLEFKIKESAE